MHGTFVNKSPHIEFNIWGINKSVAQKYIGLIDTGFNGYLVIPYALAFPLGLALIGTESSTLADGSTVTSLVCIGQVELCGITVPTTVSVQSGNSILIGTQLLERIGKDLHIDFIDGKVEFKERPKPTPPTPPKTNSENPPKK